MSRQCGPQRGGCWGDKERKLQGLRFKAGCLLDRRALSLLMHVECVRRQRKAGVLCAAPCIKCVYWCGTGTDGFCT
jgi:hypothetical protein